MPTKRVRPFSLTLVLVLLITSLFSAFPAQAASSSNAVTPCHRAELVSHVTAKDGTNFEAGEYFIKTWRLRNTGSCTWHRSYTLVFHGGDKLSNRISVYIKQEVKPGRTVDVSVRMKAPEKTGEYVSYWMLRSRDGHRFGIGASGTLAFAAKIKVGMAPTTAFNFASRPCQAAWHNANGGISCGGDDKSAAGSVKKVANPVLENGVVLSGPAVVVHPEWTENGEVRGRYDEVAIKKGDRFQATIGCLDGAQNCNVTFELRYRIQGDSTRTLRSWGQSYDGNLRTIDLDLSEMAGKQVKFFLIVRANGDASDAWAVWVNPRISR